MILTYIDSHISLCDNTFASGINIGGHVVQLGNMSIGQKAKITGYHACNLQYRRKLLVMGLTPGTELEVVGIAPLGDPIEIAIRGLFLCLRKNEAHILKLETIS